MPEVIGRFAPSPTGPLHLGSLLVATASWLHARQHQGRWILRIDDIDPLRDDTSAKQSFLPILEAHGLICDAVYFQSQRYALYQDALRTLPRFECDCSRKDIKQRGQHGAICSPRSSDTATRLQPCQSPPWLDGRCGPQPSQQLDAPVLWRRENHPSYHLACSVDEVDLGITDIIRGEDLLDATATHQSLIQLLKGQPPRYQHLPLVIKSNGQKLSKQNLAPPITQRDWRAQLSFVLQRLVPHWQPSGDTPQSWLDSALAAFSLDDLKHTEAWRLG